MNPGSIRFQTVTVRYPASERSAVENVSFDVSGGELVVLLGPSGCGKSTLLRTVNRLVPLDAGHVFVDGNDVAELDPVELRRGIGYVIQAIGLFANMTVAQNVAVVPSLLGWNRREIAQRVDELLQLVGLDPASYRTRRPSALSG
ncbi:MAG: ATP-binding cassette domain-containing protein, partial [Candidatus Cybelea sp.]